MSDHAFKSSWEIRGPYAEGNKLIGIGWQVTCPASSRPDKLEFATQDAKGCKCDKCGASIQAPKSFANATPKEFDLADFKKWSGGFLPSEMAWTESERRETGDEQSVEMYERHYDVKVPESFRNSTHHTRENGLERGAKKYGGSK